MNLLLSVFRFVEQVLQYCPFFYESMSLFELLLALLWEWIIKKWFPNKCWTGKILEFFDIERYRTCNIPIAEFLY